jgi:hypothetical protein
VHEGLYERLRSFAKPRRERRPPSRRHVAARRAVDVVRRAARAVVNALFGAPFNAA